LIAKLQNDPYLSKEFYKLYSGQDLTREEPIDELVIDTYRIQAILKHNSFEKDQHFSEKDPHSESRLEEDAEFDDCVMGIWIIPSYFNHTCVPNAKRIFYSDFMMIYSSIFIALVFNLLNELSKIIFLNYFNVFSFKIKKSTKARR
jgi:hypothetical protein